MKRLDMENGSQIAFGESSSREALRSVQSGEVLMVAPFTAHPAWVLNLFEGYPTWITLLGEPHAQQRPRHSRGGRTYKPDSAQERAIAWSLRSQWPGPPLEGPTALYVRFWVKAGIRDSSNMLKALEDAGNKLVWRDDRQIKATIVLVDVDRENPRTELAVGLRRG